MPESDPTAPDFLDDLAPSPELEAKLPEAIDADYAPPFDAKDFGGQHVWASSENYDFLTVSVGPKTEHRSASCGSRRAVTVKEENCGET